MLGVILSNLVGATPSGAQRRRGRPVRASHPHAHRKAPALRFEVEDTGPGLPPDAAPRVFEPFVASIAQPGAPASRAPIGLGSPP